MVDAGSVCACGVSWVIYTARCPPPSPPPHTHTFTSNPPARLVLERERGSEIQGFVYQKWPKNKLKQTNLSFPLRDFLTDPQGVWGVRGAPPYLFPTPTHAHPPTPCVTSRGALHAPRSATRGGGGPLENTCDSWPPLVSDTAMGRVTAAHAPHGPIQPPSATLPPQNDTMPPTPAKGAKDTLRRFAPQQRRLSRAAPQRCSGSGGGGGCIRRGVAGGGGLTWRGGGLLTGSPYGPRERWAENFEAVFYAPPRPMSPTP